MDVRTVSITTVFDIAPKKDSLSSKTVRTLLETVVKRGREQRSNIDALTATRLVDKKKRPG